MQVEYKEFKTVMWDRGNGEGLREVPGAVKNLA